MTSDLQKKKTAPIYCFAFIQLNSPTDCHPQHIIPPQHTRDILGLCEEFVPGNPPEFFFDRNPENFGTILEMYRYSFTEIKSQSSSSKIPFHLVFNIIRYVRYIMLDI